MYTILVSTGNDLLAEGPSVNMNIEESLFFSAVGMYVRHTIGIHPVPFDATGCALIRDAQG